MRRGAEVRAALFPLAASALGALFLGGCVAVDVDGGALTLPPEALSQARIGPITLSSRGALVPDGYIGMDVPGLRQELERCARGDRPLALRLDVEGASSGWRDISVIAEFVDPARNDLIVGRYFMRPREHTRHRGENLLDDREMTLAEEVGYAVCNTVFNPAADTPPTQD